MQKRLFPLLVFLAAPLASAFAQEPRAYMQSTQQNSASGQAGNAATMRMNDFTTLVGRNGVPLHGSPYLDNRWLPAHLITINNVKLPLLPLKYDVLNRQLLMRPPEQPTDSLRLDDSQLVSFELEVPGLNGGQRGSRLFRRFAESPQPTQRPIYVEVLHEGKYTLLKRYVKAVRKTTPRNGFESAAPREEIINSEDYYLCLPGSSAIGGAARVKLTLKGLQSAAPQLAQALAAAPGAQTASTDAEWAAVLAVIDPK